MIFYNKDIFKKAGIDPENPPLSTHDEFLATSRKIVDSGAADAAIWPAPTSEFFQSWFDFYPDVRRRERRQQLVEDGEATFDSDERQGGRRPLGHDVRRGLSPKETYNGDSFAEGKAAMAIVGPWAIAVYGERWTGAWPGADLGRHQPRGDLHVLRRQEHRALLGLREPADRLGGAEVRDQRGAGRQAARDDRADAAA